MVPAVGGWELGLEHMCHLGEGHTLAGPSLLPAWSLSYASSSYTRGSSCGSSHTAWDGAGFMN